MFDMLDVDGSGGLEFDEFYLLMCILIAVKVTLDYYYPTVVSLLSFQLNAK